MGWEDVVNVRGGNSQFFKKIADDEVSVIFSKQKTTVTVRVNAKKIHFPKNAKGEIPKTVKIRVDREKKRIGFFKDEISSGHRLIPYGKVGDYVYISVGKVMKELGFEKGRYKILKKEDTPEMYFYLSPKKKSGELEIIPNVET
jgi:hypothetical protein